MTSICVSMAGKTVSADPSILDRCIEKGVSMIELRIDMLDKIPDLAREISLIRGSKLESILTVRPAWEGGHFQGNEEERYDLLRSCIEGIPDHIDLEMNMERTMLNRLIDLSAEMGVRAILSHHDHSGTPSLSEIISMMDQREHDLKLVFTCNSLENVRVLTEACKYLKGSDRKYSIMGMGEHGHITRIIAPLLGCDIVYASYDEPIVEGQLSLESLTAIWNNSGIGGLHG